MLSSPRVRSLAGSPCSLWALQSLLPEQLEAAFTHVHRSDNSPAQNPRTSSHCSDIQFNLLAPAFKALCDLAPDSSLNRGPNTLPPPCSLPFHHSNCVSPPSGDQLNPTSEPLPCSGLCMAFSSPRLPQSQLLLVIQVLEKPPQVLSSVPRSMSRPSHPVLWFSELCAHGWHLHTKCAPREQGPRLLGRGLAQSHNYRRHHHVLVARTSGRRQQCAHFTGGETEAPRVHRFSTSLIAVLKLGSGPKIV